MVVLLVFVVVGFDGDPVDTLVGRNVSVTLKNILFEERNYCMYTDCICVRWDNTVLDEHWYFVCLNSHPYGQVPSSIYSGVQAMQSQNERGPKEFSIVPAFAWRKKTKKAERLQSGTTIVVVLPHVFGGKSGSIRCRQNENQRRNRVINRGGA